MTDKQIAAEVKRLRAEHPDWTGTQIAQAIAGGFSRDAAPLYYRAQKIINEEAK